MSDLREQLIAAKIAGAKTGQGYEFRTNENAAEVAVAVFVEWLREQCARELRREAARFPTGSPGRHDALKGAVALERVADALSQNEEPNR